MIDKFVLSKILPDAEKYLGVYTQKLAEIHTLAQFLSESQGISGGSADISNWFPMAAAFEESSFKSKFFEEELHPTIHGYDWYRAYWIEYLSQQGVILAVPWISPQESRPSIVLLVGDPPATWVVDVINAYLDNKNAWLEDASWFNSEWFCDECGCDAGNPGHIKSCSECGSPRPSFFGD